MYAAVYEGYPQRRRFLCSGYRSKCLDFPIWLWWQQFCRLLRHILLAGRMTILRNKLDSQSRVWIEFFTFLVYLLLLDVHVSALERHIRRPVPSLSRRVAGFDFFLFWVALSDFLYRQIHAVFVKDLQMLFGVGNVTVDVVRVNLSFTSRRKWLPL